MTEAQVHVADHALDEAVAREVVNERGDVEDVGLLVAVAVERVLAQLHVGGMADLLADGLGVVAAVLQCQAPERAGVALGLIYQVAADIDRDIITEGVSGTQFLHR